MTDNAPVPIRPDVELSIDAAREMRDWVSMQLQKYIEDTGIAPHSIVVVLLGEPVAGSVDTVNSWTPTNEDMACDSVCAMAATLCHGRALGII